MGKASVAMARTEVGGARAVVAAVCARWSGVHAFGRARHARQADMHGVGCHTLCLGVVLALCSGSCEASVNSLTDRYFLPVRLHRFKSFPL